MKSNAFKIVLAVVLLAGAGVLFARFLRHDDGISEQTFFYDLKENKLFAAPRDAIPPIRGLKDAQEVAVRAVVIAPAGNPNDKAARQIAYLEKYSPELKRHIEAVRAGTVEAMPTHLQKAGRFVKRVADDKWFALNTPEAERIMTEWNVAAPDGKYPVVCVP